ncbi:glucose-1-phosphate cytidylyltransferase [Paenibacillus chartarius]|uniref:Glucose-1-phosphate cytidylyltransferase n=1 Tax=Paenibacillus chartarius TaxID=747481 RepID=A0ABV6DMP5_9BACL
MKVVILAGGYGTRLSEETSVKPKPMVEIGGRPILWHIMKLYSRWGFQDFVICLGYKGDVIKEYFERYYINQSDVTFDYNEQDCKIIHNYHGEPWKVTLVFTGEDTMTGGRVKRIAPYIGSQPFLLTYGDGLSDVNIGALVDYHFSHGRLATVTTVQPSGRFGSLRLDEHDEVEEFVEKPKGDGGWINGGFFVMSPEVFELIDGDETVLEKEPLERLVNLRQLMAFRHTGFWHPMDTLRDKMVLEKLWSSGNAPWKTW